jgi:hypothetical protein
MALLLAASGSFAGATADKSQAELAASQALVIGETWLLDSQLLSEQRRINVYLPAAYSAEQAQALPVMYMLDGGIAEDFLHVAGLLQVLSGNGGMRPFVLVGIENTERRRDLTGPTEDPEDRKIAPRVGGSKAFRRFLSDELMPQVRQRYHVTAEAGIIGESLAGLFVVETFLEQPQLFDHYIALDPSLWWNRAHVTTDLAERVAAHDYSGKQLWIATSSDPKLVQLGKGFSANLAALKLADFKVVYQPMPDETHMSIYHPAALKAFRGLFAP